MLHLASLQAICASKLNLWNSALIFTHGSALSNFSLFLAIDAGLIEAHGVEVTAPALDGFASTASRLRDGTAEIGTTGFTQVLADAESPDPLVIVAGSGVCGMALLGRPKTALSDVRGVVGTFSDDPMEVLLADELAHHGIENRVVVRHLTSLVEAADALLSGAVDVITTVEPWISKLVEKGCSLLSDGTEVWGSRYPDTVLVARRSTAVAKHDQIISVISAMLEAERMILDDPDSALAVVAHRFPLFTHMELLAGFAGQPPCVDLRGLEGTILNRWSTVRKLAGLPDRAPPAGLIDFTCLVAALARETPAPTRGRNIH